MSSSQNNKPAEQAKPKKPNETGTIQVAAHFRVFDPKTQKTIVEGRG